MDKNKAFTIVELLVVMSIFTLLLSLIMIPMSASRLKAKDSRIGVDMSQVRTIAALYFANNNNTYAGLNADAGIVILFDDIAKEGGEKPSTPFIGGIDLIMNDTEYCAETRMNIPAFWCVDSTGASKQYDNNPACDAIAHHYTCD